MNIHPTFTNIRSYSSDQFSALRKRARQDLLLAKLTGRKTSLAVFPEDAPEKSPNRRYVGVYEIPVKEIIGTLNRRNDFDHQFRPLHKSLQDRWVHAHLSLQVEGWEPILVHKVEENYYVEDGHHRVSVARSLGLAFIQARVWEYPCVEKGTKDCTPNMISERSSLKGFAPVTEEGC
jgi:hypothetical protein